MSLTRVASGIAAVFGLLLLFYIFCWCTLVPPGLAGSQWWAAVLENMVSRGAIAGTVLGAVVFAGGITLQFLPGGRIARIVAAILTAALAILIIVGIAGG